MPNPVYKIAMMKPGLPFQPSQRSLQRLTKLTSLSFSLLSHYQNLPCVPFLVCMTPWIVWAPGQQELCHTHLPVSTEQGQSCLCLYTPQAPDNSTWHIRGAQNIQGIQTKVKTCKPSFARLNFGSKTHWFTKPGLCSYF